jgi:hypothetical protein
MTTAAKEGRTSVLASLTAEVMGEKTKAAKATLTPVAGESTFPLERALIPNDTGTFMSNEGLHDHAKNLRKFASEAIAIADGLDAILQESSSDEKVVDLDAARKAKEAEGDAKAEAAKAPKPVEPEPENNGDGDPETSGFAADFAAKQAAAQAATFSAPTGKGWHCPVHNKPGVPKVSGKGRDFIGCPDCNQFQG